MPSSTELSLFFREGKLGEMLTREFGGTVSTINSCKDLEFSIDFKCEEKTPELNPILKKITEFYSGLGYEVELKEECFGDDNFVVIIHHDKWKASWSFFIIVLTTKYSIKPGGDKKFILVTSLRV